MTFGPIRDKMEFRPQMFWKRVSGLAARDDQKRGYDFNYSGDNSIKKPQDAYFSVKLSQSSCTQFISEALPNTLCLGVHIISIIHAMYFCKIVLPTKY